LSLQESFGEIFFNDNFTGIPTIFKGEENAERQLIPKIINS
jgi:hypothetical protein